MCFHHHIIFCYPNHSPPFKALHLLLRHKCDHTIECNHLISNIPAAQEPTLKKTCSHFLSQNNDVSALEVNATSPVFLSKLKLRKPAKTRRQSTEL